MNLNIKLRHSGYLLHVENPMRNLKKIRQYMRKFKIFGLSFFFQHVTSNKKKLIISKIRHITV